MQRALVTGGAGFIGSHLVRELVSRGVAVRVLDNLSSGSQENLAGVGNRIEFHEGDVRNAVACRNACRGVDTVFHLAALVSVPQSVADPIQADAINSGGTLNMLIAARDQRANRLVFSSSAAVYGDIGSAKAKESMQARPMSPYGVQKLTGEHYARNFTLLYGLDTVCLRYFNVYGPRQNPQSAYAAVIPKFVTSILEGAAPTVFGDGEQTRDFCFVGDVVAANLLAATVDNSEVPGETLNVASGSRTSLNSLLARLNKVSGSPLPADYKPARAGDIRHSAADITKARSALGYTPATTLTTGLRQTVKYYRDAAKAGR